MAEKITQKNVLVIEFQSIVGKCIEATKKIVVLYHDKGEVWLAKQGMVREWFCYIIVDFETAASQNDVCITQQMCYMIKDLFPRLLYDKKVIQNLMVFLIFCL